MKAWKKVIAVFLTILVLFIGLLLPKLVLQYQDLKSESQVSRYELNDVSLNLYSQLWDRIATVQNGYLIIGDGIGMDTELTEDEVYQEMYDIDKLFGQMISDSGEILYVETIPELVIGMDSSFSFIIWECVITHEHSLVTMTVDDTTGKMLSFDCNYTDDITNSEAIDSGVVDNSGVNTVVSVRMPGEELDILCERLKEYYEIPEAYRSNATEESLPLGVDSYDAYGGEFLIHITLKDENGNEIDFPYYINGAGYYSLNK